MTEQTHENPDRRTDGYPQFAVAMAVGMMLSAAALFFFEYFGIIDVIKCWP